MNDMAPVLPMLRTAQSARDAGRSLLPAEHPLEMPRQDFSSRRSVVVRPAAPGHWIARGALFFGAGLMTASFALELYSVLAFVRATPVQVVFLVLSTLAFGWIAFGSLSAALGFLPLYAGEPIDTMPMPEGRVLLHHRTALLFPVYSESPADIAATIEAVVEELDGLDCARAFDVFVLSDTRPPEHGLMEERAYQALALRLAGRINVYYRRRRENSAQKAGNIQDWVERFGGAYESFVILDADSIMSAETLVRLSAAMEANRQVGLIQTVPRLVGGTTLLQKLQQFAAAIYGPSVSAGLAFWQRAQGNYWGHNAIIRTGAFASAAGLPTLPGRRPFGGPIQSHDFVEAVALQRAGWEVHLVPSAAGSFEGSPPGLIDLVVRDRRWAQGNLQHLMIVGARGLGAMGRVHLAMGAMAYVVSAIWFGSLLVGVVLAIQGQVIPSYFPDERTLFPSWPVIDPGAAFRLFLATLAVVMLPKALGLMLEIRRGIHARETLVVPRAVAGVLVETVLSMLIAPILMMTQTSAVLNVLAGRDTGWKSQRRAGGGTSFADAAWFHRWHTLAGMALGLVCVLIAVHMIGWMAPIIVGLAFSAPLTWATARPAGPLMSRLLATPHDRLPAPILFRADELAGQWRQQINADWASGAEREAA